MKIFNTFIFNDLNIKFELKSCLFIKYLALFEKLGLNNLFRFFKVYPFIF